MLFVDKEVFSTVRTYSAPSDVPPISPPPHKAFPNTSLSQQLMAVKTFIKATFLIHFTSIPAEDWAGRVQPCARKSAVYVREQRRELSWASSEKPRA